MSSASSSFSATEKERAWKWLQVRFLQVMTIYVWQAKAATFLSNLKEGEIQLLKNAALESTLMSVRDADDFFQSTRTKTDDLRVGDFGSFPVTGSLLTLDERTIINKCLAHLTSRRVLDSGTKAGATTIDGLNLLKKAVTKIETFCDFLATEFKSSHSHLLDGIDNTKKLIQKWMVEAEKDSNGKFEINADTLQV